MTPTEIYRSMKGRGEPGSSAGAALAPAEVASTASASAASSLLCLHKYFF